MVTHRLQRTPMAQIFLAKPLTAASSHTPVSPVTFTPETVIRQGKNDHLFQVTQVDADIGIISFKVQYRITHNLLRTMESNISSPVCFVKFYASRFQLHFAHEQVFHVSALA